ncbi:MAG: carboxypeptidase-like regulatory domain-containing protein [Gemmatimonadales bacterium]
MTAGLALLALAVAAAPVFAQTVSGRLRSADDGQQLAGAIVLLLDAGGREIGRTISSGSGGFSLAGAPGTGFRLRVLRIGFNAWMSEPFSLEAGERKDFALRLEEHQIVLPDVTVVASRCRVRPGESDIIGQLLNEAEKALALTDLTIRKRTLLFRTSSSVTRPTHNGGTVVYQDSSVGLASWPITSAPPESLAVWGFVHIPDTSSSIELLHPEMGPVYFGPDARVLFADWFLSSHCFSVTAADSRIISIGFEPEAAGSRVDLRGTLEIERRTMQLDRIEFHYTGLPAWVPENQAGGEMSFRRLENGAWLVTEWRLRAPVPLVRGRRDTTLFGFAESRGRVTGVVNRADGSRVGS